MKRVLEVNVDDMGFGGVYSLVRNVILAKGPEVALDIACIEPFEQRAHIEELKQYGCEVHYVGYVGNKIKKQFVVIRTLRDLLKAGDYDAVHIHGDVAYKLLVYSVASRLAGVKTIILHSHASGTDGSHRGLKEVLHKASRRFLKWTGTDFVSCSDLASDWMFPNVRRNKITVIHNGVDLDRFRFDPAARAAMREEWDLEDSFVLGHVGRFEYQKNHEYLVKVFAEVKQQVPSAKLFLVGEGSLREETRQKVRALGLEQDVLFAGLSNEVPKLLSGFDVFVLPSHFEGLPIVGVEAQAAGLPVVFADTITKEAKLTEAVTYLPIGEEDLPAWAKAVSTAADLSRQDPYESLKAQHFSLDDTVAEFLALYQ
ncbi:MAG: glycosyltransferase [Clostridia bacterium]|nr:glycosyltransferase [Clostridia bacterium]